MRVGAKKTKLCKQSKGEGICPTNCTFLVFSETILVIYSILLYVILYGGYSKQDFTENI